MADVYVIEKDVPLPSDVTGPAKLYTVLKAMQPGDSVVVDAKKAGYASSATHAIGRDKNKKFSRRTQPDGSIRIWCVEAA